jgi:hypothetical protein
MVFSADSGQDAGSSHQERDQVGATHHAPSPNAPRREENASRAVSPEESVRARIVRPHKGDLGREETNEEIFQGSKSKELQ